MGPSVGFVRGWLSLWALAAVAAIVLAGANELLDAGLFPGGYPVLGDHQGSYGEFAAQLAALAFVLLFLSGVLSRWD